MKDATRLVEEGADDFELGLLRSADRDAGDARAVERTLAAMGVAALATTVTRAVAGSTTLARTTPAAATGAGVGGAVASGVARFTVGSATSGIVGLAVGVAIGLGLPYAAAGEDVETARSSMARLVPSAMAIDAVAAATEAAQEAAPAVEAELPASIRAASTRAGPAVAPRSEARHAPVAPTASVPIGPGAIALSEEVALLDRARAALAAGNAGRALRALDVYDAACPAGALEPEARVLRVEALAASGDRRRAEEVAEPMLRGTSPHERRVRSVLADDH
jgi:hypothetical protein